MSCFFMSRCFIIRTFVSRIFMPFTLVPNFHFSHFQSPLDAFDVSSPYILAVSSLSNSMAQHTRHDKLDWLDTLVSTRSTRVSCRRVERWRDAPSGIWAILWSRGYKMPRSEYIPVHSEYRMEIQSDLGILRSHALTRIGSTISNYTDTIIPTE